MTTRIDGTPRSASAKARAGRPATDVAGSRSSAQVLDDVRAELRKQLNWMLADLSSPALIDLTFKNVLEAQKRLKLTDAKTQALLQPYGLASAFREWKADGGRAGERDLARWSQSLKSSQGTTGSFFSRYSADELRAALKRIGP